MRSLRRVLWILVIVVALSACGQGGYPDSVRFPGADASLFRGPDHCDWDGTWMVYLERDDLRSPTTWIGGTEVPGPFPALHMFVRDPGAVRNYAFEAPTDLHRDIPPDARLLGSSSAGYELWYSDSDTDYIYVVSPERTEAWVRAIDWALCA